MSKPIPKMSFMITSAIRNLRQAQGSTSKEIMNYITSRYDSLEPAMQRQMSAALKRGLDYGILKKSRGHYKLNSMTEHKARTRGGPMEKPASRRGKQHRSSAKKTKRKGHRDQRRKGKGRGTAKSRTGTRAGRCRCTATRGRNAYALEADIPQERLQEQSTKDVVCCYENKWKEQGDNGTDSMDQSRSTLGSDPEVNHNNQELQPEKIF